MITRVRESEDGGFDVIVASDEGEAERRNVKSLFDALDMQKSVQDTGKWPDGKEVGRGSQR